MLALDQVTGPPGAQREPKRYERNTDRNRRRPGLDPCQAPADRNDRGQKAQPEVLETNRISHERERITRASVAAPAPVAEAARLDQLPELLAQTFLEARISGNIEQIRREELAQLFDRDIQLTLVEQLELHVSVMSSSSCMSVSAAHCACSPSAVSKNTRLTRYRLDRTASPLRCVRSQISEIDRFSRCRMQKISSCQSASEPRRASSASV